MLKKIFSFKWIFSKEDQQLIKPQCAEQVGFLDYLTGRRVEIDTDTGKEYFID